MTETFVLENGVVALSTYTRDDILGRRVNSLIHDLYINLPDLKEDLYLISKIRLKGTAQITDVIAKFFETKPEYKDKLVFTQAGALTIMKASDKITTRIDEITEERSKLFAAGFRNVVFNRRMAESYTISDYFIYDNANSKEFINKNTGDNNTSIIARTLDK